MLFEIQKPRLTLRRFYFKQHSPPRRLFYNNHKNMYFISILPRQQNRADRLERSRSNRRESCSLLHPRDFRNADDW